MVTPVKERFRLTDENIYLKVLTPLDSKERKFILTRLEGREAISEPFFYSLTMKTDDNAISFDKILKKPITVSIEMYNKKKRYINGVVTRFVQGDNDGNIVTYFAEIRPWLWQLSLTSDCRIYQEMTVNDIISDVFSKAGFKDFSDKTTGSYATREYCVQYRETAFDFVSRLMEEEGIFYFFEHEKKKHTLILADATSAHKPCPDFKKARYSETGRGLDELIEECSLEMNIIPNKYAAEDYNFETPETDLLTIASGKTRGKMRHYEYPGKFSDTGAGEKIVNKRMEIFELPEKIIRGTGNCRAFISGYKFDLTKHDRSDLNDSWVIMELDIMADQNEYSNRFSAFPAKTQFRPPIITPKPKIYGSQTALVVGKKGEEIWPDKYGRVKVQFYWDQEGKKDEKSSCWIRVAQNWAGKKWGAMFIPRIGSEAVVSFLDGDPDRPLIIGTVYNATQTVPYALPDEKTKSTVKTNTSKGGGGFNEIRFEDKKDSEEIFIHAQKDKNIVIENDRSMEIKNNDTITITKDRSLTIKEGKHIFRVEKGDETYEVKGKRTATVTGDESYTNKGKYNWKVGGDFKLTVDGKLTVKVSGEVVIKGSKIKLN